MSETARQRGSETGGGGRPRGVVRTFRDLIAWQRATELAVEVYAATRTMPADERFGLTNQMRRAAVSVPSNIAEGHGRQSRTDYVRFLRIARGSLAELSTQMEIAVRTKMLPESQQLSDLAVECAWILQALIRSLEALDAEKDGGRNV